MGFCSAEDPNEGDDGSGCKTCRYFWGLDVPITDLIPLEQLQVDAAAKSFRTFKAFVALNTLLKRYEEVIRKRWIKRNVSQKTAILTEAWPGIATTHRPDFEGLRDGCKRHRKRSDKTKVREAHIWPSINLEDLVQPYTLLLYINSRGRNLPFKFAFADSLALHVEEPGRSEVADTYFMQLHGQNTPRSYGSLAVYPDPGVEVEPTSSSGFTPSEVGFNPYEGLQVLEVQARILEFLLRCGRLILRDYCLDRIISIPTKAVPHMSSVMKSSSTITALATEAPYRLPQRLDIKRLLEVVSARRRAAEDHVWALREDPGYFAREMKDWAEHEPSNILDKFKKPHYCVGEPSFWSKVAQKMITHAYGSLIHWDHARKLLNNLRIGEDCFGQQTDTNTRLDPTVETHFAVFEELIKEMKHSPLNDLALGFAASPPLRGGYIRDPKDCSPMLHDVTATLGKHRHGERRMHDLFRSLLDPAQHRIHGLSNIVEEIQRTVDHEEDGNLLTPWVAERFADLAMIVEITRQLAMLEPWATGWQDRLDTHGDDCTIYEIEEYEALKYVFWRAKPILSIVDPADYLYPSDKRRTEAVVKQMRTTEQALDCLWDTIDDHVERITGQGLNDLLAFHMEEPDRTLQRTPRWENMKNSAATHAPLPRATGSTPRKGQKNPATLTPLGDLDPNARHARPSKASLMHVDSPKIKVKTRGEAGADNDTPSGTEPLSKFEDDTTDATPKQTMTVSKRTYKVFTVLFHVSVEHQAPGEVAWTEFLYAMNEMGFMSEKLYGSSWQFTPVGSEETREGHKEGPKPSIQFHEPHPHSRLRCWQAKRIGRRLHKTYGWHGDMFVCK